MIASLDYKGYYNDNLELLTNLEKSNSDCFARLKDVIDVLDFISDNYEKYEHDDSSVDLENIFEIGFAYFHEEIEQIKIYFEHYLNKDYFLLKRYDALINFALYVDDVTETLKENEYLTKDREETLKGILDDIEDIISKKLAWSNSDFERLNVILESIIPLGDGFNTTSDIFNRIAEEIMIIKG